MSEVEELAAEREASEKPTQATILLELAAGVDLFHDPAGTGFATFAVGEHVETAPIRQRPFRSFLERLYYEHRGQPASAQAVQDAIGVLDGRARFDGPEHEVSVRLAGDDEAIHVDLGRPDWSTVRITRNGWELTSSAAVKFRRPNGLRPLPVPSCRGDLGRLRPLVNVTDTDWPLLVGWIVGALRPSGPYPVLVSYGEQGSAKSSTQRIIRSLVDPSSAPLRSAPRNEHELVIAAGNAHVLGFDNASGVHPWLSDALARISTGAGFSARTLYTDGEETIFAGSRPVLVNGIEEVVGRADLLDRCLVVEHPRIPASQRAPERELWQAVEAAQAVIFAGILDALVAALRNLGTVELEELPRMADFCEWVVAAEPAFGWEPGRFLTTYTANRDTAVEAALDASPITAPLREIVLAGAGGFTGTSAELLEALNDIADERIAAGRSWPKNARKLSGDLRRLAPNLRESGIAVEFKRTGKRRTIAITATAPRLGTDSSVTTVTPSPTEDSSQIRGDGSGDGSDARGDGMPVAVAHVEAVCDGSDGSDAAIPTQSERTLEDVLLDPAAAEELRASVNGEWIEVAA